jgi:hypothetical protein
MIILAYLCGKFPLMLLKRTTALFLLLAFLTQALSRYFIVADYYLNTASFVKDCVNKDKPWIHCNGRCQLCKKLHQEDNSDKQSPERRSGGERNDTLTSEPSPDVFTAINPFVIITTRYPDRSDCRAVDRPRTHFHPPGTQPA